MKWTVTMAMILTMAGACTAHADAYQCVMAAYGTAESTLCKQESDIQLGSASLGEGRLILLYPNGQSEVVTSDYQDKMGMMVKLPLQQYDKIVFIDDSGVILGGVGWGDEELDLLVDRNGAGRLKKSFQDFVTHNGNGNGGPGQVSHNGNGNGGPGGLFHNGNGNGGPGIILLSADWAAHNGNGNGGPGQVSHNGNGNGGPGGLFHNGNGNGGPGTVSHNGNGNGGPGSVSHNGNDGFGPKLPSLQGINARCAGTMIFFSY